MSPRSLKALARRLVGKAVPASSPSFAALRPPEKASVLRCGVIGLGMMGKTHAAVLRRHPWFELTAVVSTNPPTRIAVEKQGTCLFDTAEQMIGSGKVDLVVIATPHWQHAGLTVAALKAGLHVVCEKPLTVTMSQADEVLTAAEGSKGRLTVVFQRRFEPAYQQVKSLLAGGELGAILRCEMVESFWRSDAYYRSGSWRGTWKGEGGGVLVNQAPHVLDRYAWLCGMPETVSGFCDTVMHRIEVEDAASAIFRHAGGMQGYVHVSTNECPTVSRAMFSCDRGRITIENGAIRVETLRRSIRAHTMDTGDPWGDIESESRHSEAPLLDSQEELLGRFYTNVARAIAGEEPLLVTGAQAANAVELATSILLSSATGQAVSLPLNRERYDAFIHEKIGARES